MYGVRDWGGLAHCTESLAVAMDLSGVGTGSEWTVIHGRSDGYWIDVLRRLQHKVPTDRRFLAS